MLDAICTLDRSEGMTYSVFKFQKLSDDEIEHYRQFLNCPVCNGKAYYRKASKDGKVACFGSRYHKADCREFKPSLAKVKEEQDAIEVNQVLVDSDALVIDFSILPTVAGGVKSNARKVNQKSKTREPEPEHFNQQGTDDVATTASGTAQDKRVSTQGLEKLLNSLLRGSELAQSDLWVYTDEKYRWRAKNLFVNFADAEPTDNGAPRMYWGTVSHSDKEMQWLNPTDCQDVGIPIDEFQQAIFKKFTIEDRRDIEGAGVIMFGKCFWNKGKTHKIIQLWGKDVSRIFISKAED
ncbi:hypothetical protein HWQ46_18245 [Shewanella sp. D64]|uniref:hypothetical protein n=1 Tax=unclassified Shewanella TaxID=196818 RepID=UPI0022BA296B|nr:MULTISPECIES: hypothetical protein [unclassified Shewanella]MEC4727489.1 hypothetical protein [Shewanella sp. D64]MEC4738102.1 hypothetical protein [Shewanella sp. E94]WBJ96384.1 hypothetical protein HWQ47_04465 [Shewanella sp. MTB7]